MQMWKQENVSCLDMGRGGICHQRWNLVKQRWLFLAAESVGFTLYFILNFFNRCFIVWHVLCFDGAVSQFQTFFIWETVK